MRTDARGRGVLTAALSILLIYGTLAPAQVQAQSPRQVAMFPSAVFRGVQAPGRYFYLSLAVIEYGPGAVSQAVSEQSRRFFTVIEGELTFTLGGKTEVYGAGKNFSAPPGVVVQGSNAGRTASARVYITSLVPARGEGAILLAPSPSAAAPRVLHSARIPVGPLPEIIDLIQGGTKYEPGFVTGLHVMNEAHTIIHLEGTTAYEYLDGFRDSFGPGQSGQMYVGRPGVMANRTSAVSAFLITWLATPGKPLTSAWTQTGH